MHILSECNVSVKYQNKIAVMSLIVMKTNNGSSLIRRNWFESLGITIQSVYSVESFHTLRRKYSAVFTGDLGPKVSIDIVENAKPFFFKARAFAFTIKPAVEKTL